ncbi:acyltransferase domain-containing protein [Streptomyces monticola]|uniref:Acyltransferase domain-containing protein n=1 Tax=Streptomyces monticola TaxID=2666263 RepID=A0ABW2JK73_9ACTN
MDLEAGFVEADELAGVLLDLAVPHEDVNALVAGRDQLLDDPARRALLGRRLRELTRDIGEIGKGPERGFLGEETGVPGVSGVPAPEAARQDWRFPVYVFVAALPHIRAYHRARGVPDDVARRTLADLGRQMAVHRRRHGHGGLLGPRWLSLHFRGELYQLGRLQFQRARLDEPTGAAVAAAGYPAGPGDGVLNLHIADFSGPLSPEACDRSLALAREFFARHYPEETYAVAECRSWLLDGQLAAYLRKDAHIVRFQDRFRPISHGHAEPEDAVPVDFVFGDPGLPVAGLPRRTSLERAVGDHLRGGGHWYVRHGWFPL